MRAAGPACAAALCLLLAGAGAPAPQRAAAPRAAAAPLPRPGHAPAASRSLAARPPLLPGLAGQGAGQTAPTAPPAVPAGRLKTAAPGPSAPAPPAPPAAARAAAARALGRAAVPDDAQWACLDELWGGRESGWDPLARNPRSTAFGVAPLLGETSADPAAQVRHGLAYVAARYGTPCAALAHSDRWGWY